MSVSGFSVSHDPQVQEYNNLRRAVLAAEQARKEEQRRFRMELGLPDLNDNRGIFSRLLRRNQKEPKVEKLNGNGYDSDEETLVVKVEKQYDSAKRSLMVSNKELCNALT